MARKTKTEAEKTRDAILDAAEKVFYERGVTRTSLDKIAQAAGVTRGAVYWHFRDKKEVCEAMMHRVFLPHEDMLEKLAARGSDKPLDDLKHSCLHALKLMATDKRRRNVASIMTLRCEYVEDMEGVVTRRAACKNRMLVSSEKLFARARRLGALAPEWTPRKAAIALQALISGLIMGVLEQRDHFDFAPMGTSCIEAFFKSLQKKAL
ncbi:MAG: TetR family transcriptional regulator [Alphaproteobacteria bacterium]|nr:TetR family transcriptional regulator [Alphaproteobacteria bacterium]